MEIEKESPKFCKDCVYFKEDKFSYTDSRCTFKAREINLVTGCNRYSSVHYYRISECGVEAKFFKPKLVEERKFIKWLKNVF